MIGGWLGTAGDALTRWRVRRRIARDTLGRLAIVAYRGWGTAEELHLGARLLEDNGVTHGTVTDPWWRNGIAMVRRFLSDEIPDGRLELRVADQSHLATTDAEGFVWLTIDNPLPGASGWVTGEWVLQRPRPRGQELQVPAPVLVPPAAARFGVISDLDDTVIRTGITDTVGMISTTLLNNARTRLPFDGVAEFYRALQQLPTSITPTDAENPVFYVSTSPWNLYDIIDEFLRVRGIPAGPMFLTDWGLDRGTFGQPNTHRHKSHAIERTLATYPALPFVLIGDSGQHDPEIYLDVARAHPKRILAVYIRFIDEPGRREELRAIAGAFSDLDVPFVHSAKTVDVAVHAHELGLIDDAGLAAVRDAVST